MTDQELENNIRKMIQAEAAPDRASLVRVLSELSPVTEIDTVRYTKGTAWPSYIINNLRANFALVWKSKWTVVVPSLILLLFIGTFSLSRIRSPIYTAKAIEALAAQDESIDEVDIVDDDESLLAPDFDQPTFDDLSDIQNEF